MRLRSQYGGVTAGGSACSPVPSRRFQPAALAAVGAGICPVGAGIEERVRALFGEREFPLSVMLDSVGSAAVESLAQ